jgi:acetyltransferase-like isoleucine patch superfamily enzyme
VALNRWGITVDRTATIRERVRFNGPNIRIGGMGWIQHDVMIDDHVTISDHVVIAPGVKIVTASHRIEQGKRAGANFTEPIEIGAGAWLGANAVVLPGAHVAKGCVIAAGAVVTSPTEPDGVYAGTPARRVKDLPV